jgi:spore coat protein H
MYLRPSLGLTTSLAYVVLVAGACGGGQAAAPPEYERLFPADRVVDVDLAITDADWATLLADPLVDVYVPATLTYDGVVVPQVGVRFKGNSSRRSVQQMGSERYSFKVDIDKIVAGQKLLGIDKLNLNNGFKDPSYLRERLGTETYRALGVPASRSAFVRLTKNGVPFGLYLAVEQVDKDFLRAHFADDSGNLYKPEIPDGDLVWRGADIASYPKLELKTNTAAPDHTAVLHLLEVLGTAADVELETELGAVFDVDSFLRYLAVTATLVNLDSYVGMAHNYYLYEDQTTGRFVVIPWDTNESFGNFGCMFAPGALLSLSYAQPICGDPATRPLVTRVLSVPAWRARYEALLRELLAGAFAPARVATDVDTFAALIRADVAADPTRFFSTADFETNLTTDLQIGRTIFGLTSFAERREAALLGQLP